MVLQLKLAKQNGEEPENPSDWITPKFLEIKKKKTKRISPYLETELWDRDELLRIISYESSKRNKAALALLLSVPPNPTKLYHN